MKNQDTANIAGAVIVIIAILCYTAYKLFAPCSDRNLPFSGTCDPGQKIEVVGDKQICRCQKY